MQFADACVTFYLVSLAFYWPFYWQSMFRMRFITYSVHNLIRRDGTILPGSPVALDHNVPRIQDQGDLANSIIRLNYRKSFLNRADRLTDRPHATPTVYVRANQRATAPKREDRTCFVSLLIPVKSYERTLSRGAADSRGACIYMTRGCGRDAAAVHACILGIASL